MLTHEVLWRDLRDERAVARYAGLTGSPDESGSRRREKGLAKAGNARVRRGMIQLAWRFLTHQKDSALAQWYQANVAAGKKAQDHDRGARPQTTHRTLAVRHHRRCAVGRGPAPGVMT
jgi:transposase